MPRLAWVAIGLVVLACSGCTQASTIPDQAPHLTSAAVDLLTTSGDYPARKHVLDAAEEQLVERCMNQRGHAYQPFVPPLVAGSDEKRMVDLPRRRAEGYGLASGESPPPSTAPDADQPRYQQALFGDDQHYQGLRLPNGSVHYYPTTGCVAESRAALYGDVLDWARTVSIPQTYDNDLRSQVKNSPELAEANSRWVSCMAASGYHYSSPNAAINDVSATYQLHGPKPDLRNREVAVATADGECELRTHLLLIELELRRAKAQSLTAGQRRDVAELASLHCAAYHKARRIVSGGAPEC
jgi:hypothetical protein